MDWSRCRSDPEALYTSTKYREFCKAFSLIEGNLDKDGSADPLNELYRHSEEMELVQAEKRVRLAGFL